MFLLHPSNQLANENAMTEKLRELRQVVITLSDKKYDIKPSQIALLRELIDELEWHIDRVEELEDQVDDLRGEVMADAPEDEEEKYD